LASTAGPLAGSTAHQGWQVLRTAFGLAIDAIGAHKLRSSLTLLGIIIGVASVVLVGSAIEGLGVYAEDSTSKAFGTNSFLVAQVASAGRVTRTELAEKLRYNKRVTRGDLLYLRSVTGDRMLYSTYRTRPDDVKRELLGQTLTYEGANIIGVSAELSEIRDLAVEEGRFFTGQEERNRQNLAVIGQEIRETLFPGKSPLDGMIRISGFDFRVIGVQEKLGSTGGQTQDNQIFIPAAAFTRMYGAAASLAIFARPRPETGLDMEGGLEVVRAALRSRFHTRPGKPDNFDVLTPDSIREFVGQILAVIAGVVVPVTTISLVVGGIVIMNIMLVSVTERTREIGIRKALGARRRDIMLQFLVEAVILAAMGGVIGLCLGSAGAKILGIFLDVELPVTFSYVLMAIVVSSSAGIVSGWYPASKAASLDPIEALRAE
jgi:putative ABC transport system permease protein